MTDVGWWRKWVASRAQLTGARGERLAAAWLRKAGFKIVARNWRSPRDKRDEIDLVCLDVEVLVFIEVKTRAAGALVSGYYAVDHRKKTAMRRAIDAYLRALRPTDRPTTFRFDIVEVEIAAEPMVRHFENIPLFGKDYGF